MKRHFYFTIASIIMIIVGILRGIGGIMLLVSGNKVPVEPPIMSSDLIARLCGIGLIVVMILFLYSAYLLLRFRNRKGWRLGLIATILFLIGGVVNGYLLFGNPFVEDQIINVIAAILILILLWIGRNSIGDKIIAE